MKKIKIILFALTATFFVGCQDAVDITQPSELTPERTFLTLEDLRLGVIGAYGRLPGERQIYFTSVWTDEVSLGINNGGQGTDGELAFLLNNADAEAASIWVGNYGAINAANRVLLGAEGIAVDPANTADVARKNALIAEARGIRALAHLQLLTFFAPDMKDDAGLGVIALDFIPSAPDVAQRATVGEVFDLINSDLDFVEANIVVPGAAAIPQIYVSRNFVYAMRARIGAYRGQYALANTNVDLITGVTLTPATGYRNMFLDVTTANEVIFKIQRNRAANWSQVWSSVNSTRTGSPFFEVGRALFNTINDPQDIRRFTVADPTSLVAPNYSALTYSNFILNDILPVGKYSVKAGLPLFQDIKVFRYSEMLLIKAEYFASLGGAANWAQVAAVINQIRDARSANRSIPAEPDGPTVGLLTPAAVPTSDREAWALILNERRKELALEGHRYIDLKRLGVLAGLQVDRDPLDCSFNGFCTLPTTDSRFTMPIPLQELDANPTIQQNAGY